MLKKITIQLEMLLLIQTELILSDLEQVERKIDKLHKQIKGP